MQRHHIASLLAATLLACAPALAQPCSGYWVQSSGVAGVTPSTSGNAGQMVTLPSGELFVTGAFNAAGNIAVSKVALYNPTTQTWSSLGWTSGTIASATLLPSGDVIVGGHFTSVAGSPANNAAIYHTQTHSWSPAGAGIQGLTSPQFAILPNGDVIAASNKIGRYSPASDSWTPINAISSGIINSLAATPAGDVIIGGHFTLTGESGTRYLAQYSPATGAWSDMGVDPDGEIYVVRALSDGSIAIGGHFLNVSLTHRAFVNIALYYPPTDTWVDLDNGVGGDPGTMGVYDILEFANGIAACGTFTASNTGPASYVAWFANGWRTWFSMGAVGANQPVGHLALLPGGDIVAAGFFDSTDNVNASFIARWNPLFDTWSPLSSGMVSSIAATAPLPDGRILVAAKFGGHFADLARYDPRTNSWDVMADNAVDGPVTAMALLPSGDILVGGTFTHTAFIPAPGLAVYHPTANTWTPLPSGVSGGGTDHSLYALAVLPSGDFVAGGAFTSAGGHSVFNTARFSPATNQWSALGLGLPPIVRCLDALPDGDLLAGGSSWGLARYHATSNSWTTFGSGAINTMINLPGGEVIVGGSGPSQLFRFSPADNTSTPITGLGSNDGVGALAYVEPNQLLVGGSITTAGGTPTTNLARLNLQTGVWSGFGVDTAGTDINGEVSSLTVLPHNDFLMGGDFTRTGSITTAFAARWIAASADYNHDGDAGTDQDIESFFQCLAGSCCPLCSTDFNGDGDLGTDQDIEAFFRVLGGGSC